MRDLVFLLRFGILSGRFRFLCWSRGSRSAAPRARRLRVEALEGRELLSASQGISDAAFAALQAEYPGVDYTNVSAAKVWSLDCGSGVDLSALKKAVAACASRSGPDVIVLNTPNDVTATFAKASDAFSISDASGPIAILATGGGRATFDANGLARAVSVSAGTSLTLGGVSVCNGAADNGGGIYNAGTLLLDRVCVSNNAASESGGGIYNVGALTAVNVLVEGNRSGGHGGGIYSSGSYSGGAATVQRLVNSTVAGNTAGLDGFGFGGGVYFQGADEAGDIFAELSVDNSIVVQNRSSATECDVNIYNSLFYNSFDVDGETYSFEAPIPALIDGSNSLSTFSWWVSAYESDDPDGMGTNALYNESTPLFIRDPDFETGTRGDYELYASGQSQAIDRGDTGLARFPNGASAPQDLLGRDRAVGTSVDLGAFESGIKTTDIAVSGVETTSRASTVVGGAIRVDGIAVANEGVNPSETVELNFYATLDGTIDGQVVFLKTVNCGSIAPGTVALVSSGDLPTAALQPGRTYRIAWRAACANDVNPSNDAAYAARGVTLCDESAAVGGVQFDRDAYSARQGDSFWINTWLSSSAPGPKLYSFWFDFGDGLFDERGNASVVLPSDYSGLPGDRAISVKVVNLASNQVVATGTAPFSVLRAAPSFNVDAESALGGDALVLDVETVLPVPDAPSRWTFDWGDGTSTAFDRLEQKICVSHLYASSYKKRTVSLTVTLGDGEEYKVSFDARYL